MRGRPASPQAAFRNVPSISVRMSTLPWTTCISLLVPAKVKKLLKRSLSPLASITPRPLATGLHHRHRL
jgi:hypothetical protein